MYTPREELYDRIEQFQLKLVEHSIDSALIVQAVDLFYFSGTAQNAHLFIPAKGEPVLMVRKSLDRAREESMLKNITQLTSLRKLPEILAEAGYDLGAVAGLEMDVVPAGQYLQYSQVFKNTRFVDISGMVREVRQVKSPYEIKLLKAAGEKINKVYLQIPGMIREGMTEIEVAAQIEGMARAAGHMGYINMRVFNGGPFFGHLLSGPSGAVPSCHDGPTGGTGLVPLHPQGAGLRAIQSGEPIIVDYVGLWDGYITDQSRIFSIGPLSEKLNHACETALKIQSAVIDRIEPGVSGSEMHQLALGLAEDAGLSEYFMGYGRNQARFLGHGVGLELDELPVLAKGLDTKLQPNMVFAIEPKFVFPGEGVVGIENTFVLTETGLERITITPDEPVII